MKSLWHVLFPLIILLGLAGCATSSIRVESMPQGASIFLNNKEVGKTPLLLKESDYRAEFKKSFAQVLLKQKGFEPISVIVKTEGDQIVNVTLVPYSEEYFSNVLTANYQSATNHIIRDLLYIQGLLIIRNFDQAEKSLSDFIAKYPNIAAPYVFKANIEIAKNNNRELAMRNLERAISIDPQDSTAMRMIEDMKKGE